MTYYPPTTLLPSSPYSSISDVITMLCERCLNQHYDMSVSEAERTQLFELTLTLVGFWESEERLHEL